MRLVPRMLFLSAFLILIAYIPSLSAQESSNGITASTNKPTYKAGEKVIITGTVEKIAEGHQVTILIRNPVQNVYNVGQITLQNNIFIHDFLINEDSKPGTYTVDIKHGDQTARLQFIVNEGLVQTIFVENSSIKVRGEAAGLIKYNGIRISTNDYSIIIDFEINEILDKPITQEFEIPKEVVDAPSQSLIVEVNGEVINCTQTETNTARILNCLIPLGSNELKITGTSVIPEFGSIAIIILLVGITCILIMTKPRQPFY
ncbi:MAG: PEFG-CTERM sorting domain-containing protein [Nitrosopumilaceae archaeon]